MNTPTIANSKPRTGLIFLLVSVLALFSAALPAEETATTINFTGLTNGGPPFTIYKESGFTISSTIGAWLANTTYGNPPPFIYFNNPDGVSTVTASIKITRDNSTFIFNSVDLYSSITQIPYEIIGYLESNIVFKVTGTIPNTFGGFAKAINSNYTPLIDTLEITLTNPSVSCCPGNPMGLDNIVLTSSHPYSWSPVNNGLIATDVNALAIDPSNPATLYAGTNGGIYKSTDDGGSWNPANNGLSPIPVTTNLVIDPSNPATLYAGTLDVAVYKSINSGGSWSLANNGLTAANVSDLVIDPSNPATLYAGTQGGGVFKSTNSGGSWSPANNGLSVTYVWALAIDPFNPDTLYAGGSGGLYKSTNGGGSWSPASKAASVSLVVIDPSNQDTLYVGIVPSPSAVSGIYKSTDGGLSWSPANNGLIARNVFALAIDPSNPAMLYAGTSAGVFKSTNSGGTWSPANNGLTAANVFALAIDPSDPATLYAGTQGGGVFKFTSLDSTECLFNWAERKYLDLFSPAGSPTAVWTIYTYRYYSGTNAYLGVSSADNHVYYMGPDRNLQDEGPLSYWLPLASCQ